MIQFYRDSWCVVTEGRAIKFPSLASAKWHEHEVMRKPRNFFAYILTEEQK